MRNRYPAFGPTFMLLMMVIGSLPARATPRRVDFGTKDMIRVSGRLVEQASQRPIEGAIIMVICGDRVLANRRSNEAGAFDLYIPSEKISEPYISLRIKYRNQLFVKDQLEAISQDILIEINGAVFLENHPIEDYKMPIHVLGHPEVGRLLIRS